MANKQRDPAKEASWRKTLQRFSTSGLSVREFCRREQVTESAFYAWRRTVAERDGTRKPTSKTLAFVPAVISDEPGPESPFVIKQAGDLELRLPPATTAERIAELVHTPRSRDTQ
ncbi:IS66 family insertion sequence element accessory protein TnpA [Adhaeretor mobilis]|uniref:Transposase n=1 Tax=Adhaeretor mobilis TaxID=1930276 RepID=A0A517N160_9BACT|nr:transposase [Adhaeretor mobilis]QDT00872.1 hypothetical protein HG15A2_42140 [Adhaeretor mobilis]